MTNAVRFLITMTFTTSFLPHVIAQDAAAGTPKTADDPNMIPNEEWFQLFDEMPEPLMNKPVIKLLSAKQRKAVVLVKNRGETTLKYNGYRKSMPQTFWDKQIQGNWKRGTWDWCGTGMKTFVIAPGKVVKFEIVFPEDENRMRATVAFTEKESEQLSFIVIALQAVGGETSLAP